MTRLGSRVDGARLFLPCTSLPRLMLSSTARRDRWKPERSQRVLMNLRGIDGARLSVACTSLSRLMLSSTARRLTGVAAESPRGIDELTATVPLGIDEPAYCASTKYLLGSRPISHHLPNHHHPDYALADSEAAGPSRRFFAINRPGSSVLRPVEPLRRPESILRCIVAS